MPAEIPKYRRLFCKCWRVNSCSGAPNLMIVWNLALEHGLARNHWLLYMPFTGGPFLLFPSGGTRPLPYRTRPTPRVGGWARPLALRLARQTAEQVFLLLEAF